MIAQSGPGLPRLNADGANAAGDGIQIAPSTEAGGPPPAGAPDQELMVVVGRSDPDSFELLVAGEQGKTADEFALATAERSPVERPVITDLPTVQGSSAIARPGPDLPAVKRHVADPTVNATADAAWPPDARIVAKPTASTTYASPAFARPNAVRPGAFSTPVNRSAAPGLKLTQFDAPVPEAMQTAALLTTQPIATATPSRPGDAAQPIATRPDAAQPIAARPDAAQIIVAPQVASQPAAVLPDVAGHFVNRPVAARQASAPAIGDQSILADPKVMVSVASKAGASQPVAASTDLPTPEMTRSSPGVTARPEPAVEPAVTSPGPTASLERYPSAIRYGAPFADTATRPINRPTPTVNAAISPAKAAATVSKNTPIAAAPVTTTLPAPPPTTTPDLMADPSGPIPTPARQEQIHRPATRTPTIAPLPVRLHAEAGVSEPSDGDARPASPAPTPMPIKTQFDETPALGARDAPPARLAAPQIIEIATKPSPPATPAHAAAATPLQSGQPVLSLSQGAGDRSVLRATPADAPDQRAVNSPSQLSPSGPATPTVAIQPERAGAEHRLTDTVPARRSATSPATPATAPLATANPPLVRTNDAAVKSPPNWSPGMALADPISADVALSSSDRPLTPGPIHGVGAAREAAHASQTTPTARAVISQITPVIAQAKDGDVELRLDPPELGRLRISLHITTDGVSATLAADRQETFDLLRRHGAELQKDLAEAGYASVNLAYEEGAQDRSDHPPLPEMNHADANPATIAAHPPGDAAGPGGDRLDIRL